MAVRSRPRGLPAKDDDAHEERDMWNRILADMKRLKTVHSRAAEISKFIVDAEEKMVVQSGRLPLFILIAHERACGVGIIVESGS